MLYFLGGLGFIWEEIAFFNNNKNIHRSRWKRLRIATGYPQVQSLNSPFCAPHIGVEPWRAVFRGWTQVRDSLFTWVQPLNTARRRESSGTGLATHRPQAYLVHPCGELCSAWFWHRFISGRWASGRRCTRHFLQISIHGWENTNIYIDQRSKFSRCFWSLFGRCQKEIETVFPSSLRHE